MQLISINQNSSRGFNTAFTQAPYRVPLRRSSRQNIDLPLSLNPTFRMSSFVNLPTTSRCTARLGASDHQLSASVMAVAGAITSVRTNLKE